MSTTSIPETRDIDRTRHPHRLRHVLVGLVIAVVVLLLAFLGAGGWYFSGQIHSDLLDATDQPVTYDLVAEPAGTGALRISGAPGHQLPDVLKTDAVYSVRTADGFVVLGAVLDQGADWVVRAVLPEHARQLWNPAAVPVGPGQDVITGATRAYAHREVWLTPADIGLDSSDVVVDGPDGPLPAWLVPGRGARAGTWAVMVHGKGGTRAEPLRSLISVSDLGLTALLVTYRNDTGVDASPDDQYGYGTTEWPDLEASVRYALDSGATDVVLFGYSLGGAIVASFLEHSPLAAHVSAVVLDAPMLDVASTVRFGASQRTLPVLGTAIPGPLVWSALQISRLRFGSDWYRADYLDDTSWVTAPTLVLQGTDDDTVPPSTATALAAAEPDLVTVVVTDGAGHVESWNVHPTAYGRTLTRFLQASLG